MMNPGDIVFNAVPKQAGFLNVAMIILFLAGISLIIAAGR